MDDRWNDSDAQNQFEREQRIWAAAAYRRKQSQSSLLWGFGSAALLIIALIALH